MGCDGLSKEVMLADLTLRGWIIQEDYLYMRLTDQTVRVCMQSGVVKERYFLTTIPYSLQEEKPPEVPWVGSDDQLRAAHEAVCGDDGSRVYPDQQNNNASVILRARVKVIGKAAMMRQAFGGRFMRSGS